jgi:hypothetical protein
MPNQYPITTEIAEKILADDINRRITDLEELIKLRLQSIDAHAQDHTRRLAALERVNTPPGESITYTRTIDGGKIRTWNTRTFNSGRRKGMMGRRVEDIKKPNYGP